MKFKPYPLTSTADLLLGARALLNLATLNLVQGRACDACVDMLDAITQIQLATTKELAYLAGPC